MMAGQCGGPAPHVENSGIFNAPRDISGQKKDGRGE